MHTIEIPGIKIKIQYASCIEELQSSEFIYMMQLLIRQKAGEITIQDFRLMLAMKLLDMRKSMKYYNMSERQREQVAENINLIVDSLDSFYENAEEDGKLVKKLNLNWVRQMIPKIGKLNGPADALTNLTFYEYKEAYNQYTAYLKSQFEGDLDYLIAILYRPRPFAYRIRKAMAFNEVQERQKHTINSSMSKLNRRAHIIKTLPAHIKTAVFIWFENCVEYIRSGKPIIDGNVIDFGILFNSKVDDSAPAGIGFTGVIYSLAESGVFGNVSDTGNANLYDVLIRLYQLKTDYDSMIAKSKKSHDENSNI
jgi:hypothetical protein